MGRVGVCKIIRLREMVYLTSVRRQDVQETIFQIQNLTTKESRECR